MSTFYSRKLTTVVIDEENTVQIQALAYGEQQNVMSSAMAFEVSMNKQNDPKAGSMTTGRLDPSRMKTEELIASVVSWSGPGFEDRPVTRENILALPVFVTDLIQAGIDSLNKGMDEATKKR